MVVKKKKTKNIIHKLGSIYRFVIVNDRNLEERFSFRSSLFNFLVLFLAGVVVMFICITVLVPLTPLKKFMPGYSGVNLEKKILKLNVQADSLEKELALRDQYVNNIKQVLLGNPADSNFIETLAGSGSEIQPESALLKVKLKDPQSASAMSGFFFFSPLRGTITNRFNADEEHYGLDIVAGKDEAIKATLDGTVIFADWTVETGYVIGIQHGHNLLSWYKHNSVLMKKTGDFVKAGDPVAIIGETGELTSGPHLHFELWYNGKPLDPEGYMGF